jgi:cytoskeleton protein RodZ
MSDFGAKLREARERRGVSLREIAEHTKFSLAALEAIERSDASRLPGGIFARAFVRSYAAEVGLDPEATVQEFVQRFNVEPAPSAIVPTDAPDEPRSSDPLTAIVPALLKLVAISLIAVVIILYFTRLRHTDDATVMPTDARRTSRRVVSVVPKDPQVP